MSGIFDKLIGCGVLLENDVNEVLCEICCVLIEVDVVLLIVWLFIDKVCNCVVGVEVVKLVMLG